MYQCCENLTPRETLCTEYKQMMNITISQNIPIYEYIQQDATLQSIFFNLWFRSSWFNVNKMSNLMQQYADIYLLQSHSTYFGRHSAHHQEY